jgi:antitoxin component YwqK of YwqJK toxin-antitoxin module
MKTISLLLLTLAVLSCGAPSEYVNKDGHLEKHEVVNGAWHGHGTKYFESGELAAIGNWKNGEMHGDFKEYLENGNLSLETTYVDGIEHGIRKTYFETGQLSATREIINGQITGAYTKYYKNGKIENIAELENNQLNGESIIYDSLGIISKKQVTINGITKYFEEYYPNGNLEIKGEEYKPKGITHKLYYENGSHKEYRYLRSDTLIYQKLFAQNGTLTGLLFPIQIRTSDSQICIGLEHSIISTDSLVLEVYLGDTLQNSIINESNPRKFRQEGLEVCISSDMISNKIILGYLCEIFKPTGNYNGCFPFAYDVVNKMELNKSEYTKK